MFCKRFLFKEYMLEGKLIFTRNLSSKENCSLKIVQDNSAIDKKKNKITIIRQRLPSKDKSSSILEWKTASSVIKRLNWENKLLFGPLQSSTTSTTYSHKNKYEFDQIIQNEAKIHVNEPSRRKDDTIKPNLKNSESTFDLNLISSFPLINQSEKSINNPEIDDLNYLRKHLENLCKSSSIPSVTSILFKTMSQEQLNILNLWKQKMIQQLGEEGFEKYQKELLATGSSLHAVINNYLSSTPETKLQIKTENLGHWKSLKNIFPCVTEVKLLEEFVSHPFLCYRGVVDCFAKYKNHLVLIDWKASKKSKLTIESTYDNPLQIAAYVGALNFDPKFQYLVKNGLIVIAYESGMPATAHFIDEKMMLKYWKEWLLRVKKFWELKELEDKSS